MNQLKPMLLTSLKNYNRSQFVKDVTAGIIVAIIALPLSIALALASGVGPEAGIFTAIVAGFHCNYPCRSFSDPDGTLPLRKSDQIYSIYDHNRIYIRNCSDDRDRTVKRFLWYFLPQRSKTN